jgi:hypothetical protein
MNPLPFARPCTKASIFGIQGFKALGDTTLQLASLTVMFGPKKAGQSNLLMPCCYGHADTQQRLCTNPGPATRGKPGQPRPRPGT